LSWVQRSAIGIVKSNPKPQFPKHQSFDSAGVDPAGAAGMIWTGAAVCCGFGAGGFLAAA
jgi:hypothetical protein